MYHFFVKTIGCEDEIRISGADFNHIKNAVRMKPGEAAVISDENGGVFRCSLSRFEEREAVFVKEAPEKSSELKTKVVLYQGLPKSDKLEFIIQKAVELGAFKIVPVEMKRSVIRLDEKKKQAKTARWQALSQAAAKQSGRAVIPQVAFPVDFDTALEMAKDTQLVLPYEEAEGVKSFFDFLGGIKTGDTVSVFIGPEGGFEREEVEKAKSCGAKIVSLGRRILRTETAAVSALCAIMLFQEKNEE